MSDPINVLVPISPEFAADKDLAVSFDRVEEIAERAGIDPADYSPGALALYLRGDRMVLLTLLEILAEAVRGVKPEAE